VPQEDDVVTPPVALGDTEHGPCGVNAGSACRSLPEDAVPGVAICDGEPPTVEFAGFVLCASADPNAASPMMIARMKGRAITLSISALSIS